ncbi:anti-sigma factor [Pseudomonas sp. Marseille-QA0892]
MNQPDHDPDAPDLLAGEYVLGTLDADARADVERRLPHEPGLRDAVERWEVRLRPLNDRTAPTQPSDLLWMRIERSLEDSANGNSASLQVRWWNRLPLWRGLAATGLAASVILATLLAVQPPAKPEYMVVLVAPQDRAPGWVVQASSPREVQLIPLGAVTVPADKALEFWTKADDWQGPVSLGLVEPGGTLRISLDKLPPLEQNQLFELTLEGKEGSPTGKPTGPIQFIGRAVKVI